MTTTAEPELNSAPTHMMDLTAQITAINSAELSDGPAAISAVVTLREGLTCSDVTHARCVTKS
jgi:hypothetical protein